MLTPEQARLGLQALKRAVDLAGSPTALARLLATRHPKIKQAHVWNWLKRDKKVPPDMAVPIEEAVSTLARLQNKPPVLRHELRGDLYRDEPAPPRAPRASRAQRPAVSASTR